MICIGVLFCKFLAELTVLFYFEVPYVLLILEILCHFFSIDYHLFILFSSCGLISDLYWTLFLLFSCLLTCLLQFPLLLFLFCFFTHETILYSNLISFSLFLSQDSIQDTIPHLVIRSP